MPKIDGPFWRYYGGKWRAAPKYADPKHKLIIEPFAGAAGYSLRHYKHDVLLIDKSEVICGIWDYLIRTPQSELSALPDILPGQSVDDLAICQEARWLIGFWCNPASSAPCKTPSTWMLDEPRNWNTLGRSRCVAQAPLIRHWKILHGSYLDAPSVQATWFVDPPYQGKAGSHYPQGSKTLDYVNLADWCQSRQGQVIVCEGPEATWLPFQDFATIKGCDGKHRSGKSVERIWLHEDEPDSLPDLFT